MVGAKKHSGVAKRHHVSYEDVGEMGAQAAHSALENAGLSLSDIELLLNRVHQVGERLRILQRKIC